MEKIKIVVSKNHFKTTDVVVYNLPKISLVDFFSTFDIWGSKGYDRYDDGGLYFELPEFVYDHIEEFPFIKKYNIEIEKK